MSGFADRYPEGRRPEGRRRGTGQNLQAQWEAENPGHARQPPQDAPAAETHHVAPTNQEEPQPVMEEVDASGYTLQDPLEADEPTGGAQFEEEIEEPPPIQDAPLNQNFAHMMREEPTPAQQEYQSAGQEEGAGRRLRRRRFAAVELTEVSKPRFVRESTTPHTTSEYFAEQARLAKKTGVPLIEPEEDPQNLPVEATHSKGASTTQSKTRPATLPPRKPPPSDIPPANVINPHLIPLNSPPEKHHLNYHQDHSQRFRVCYPKSRQIRKHLHLKPKHVNHHRSHHQNLH